MFSVLALGVNLLLLVGILAAIGVTMTLPGIAAVALTLGMAIDSNVLINERIRRSCATVRHPRWRFIWGYERAFATILDSNITTLIAGVALLIFGTGRFAVLRSCIVWGLRPRCSRRYFRARFCRMLGMVVVNVCSRFRSGRFGVRASTLPRRVNNFENQVLKDHYGILRFKKTSIS